MKYILEWLFVRTVTPSFCFDFGTTKYQVCMLLYNGTNHTLPRRASLSRSSYNCQSLLYQQQLSVNFQICFCSCPLALQVPCTMHIWHMQCKRPFNLRVNKLHTRLNANTPWTRIGPRICDQTLAVKKKKPESKIEICKLGYPELCQN